MKQPKVFIVDDDKVFSKLLNKKVTDTLNAKTYLFDSGEKCLDNLFIQPDIVLLDFYMRDLDGLETLCKIMEAEPKTDVILISGQERGETAISALEMGAKAYLDKNADTFPLLEEHLKKLWAAKQKNDLYLDFRIRKDVAFITGGFLIALLLIWFISGVL